MGTEVDNGAFGDEEEWGPPPTPQPVPTNVRIVIEGGRDEPLVKALTTLLIGSATEGGDQLARRLKEWQSNANSLGSGVYSESPNESEAERMRYALIGLLSDAPTVAQGVLETALDVTESAYRILSGFFEPVTTNKAMRPVWRRYNELAARGETIAEGWIDKGRREEQRGRALARQAYVDEKTEAFDIVFDQLNSDPQPVRDLVTQQSFGMADEVMGQLRSRSASADNRVESRIRRILRLAPTPPQE